MVKRHSAHTKKKNYCSAIKIKVANRRQNIVQYMTFMKFWSIITEKTKKKKPKEKEI